MRAAWLLPPGCPGVIKSALWPHARQGLQKTGGFGGGAGTAREPPRSRPPRQGSAPAPSKDEAGEVRPPSLRGEARPGHRRRPGPGGLAVPGEGLLACGMAVAPEPAGKSAGKTLPSGRIDAGRYGLKTPVQSQIRLPNGAPSGRTRSGRRRGRRDRGRSAGRGRANTRRSAAATALAGQPNRAPRRGSDAARAHLDTRSGAARRGPSDRPPWGVSRARKERRRPWHRASDRHSVGVAPVGPGTPARHDEDRRRCANRTSGGAPDRLALVEGPPVTSKLPGAEADAGNLEIGHPERGAFGCRPGADDVSRFAVGPPWPLGAPR